MERPYFLMGTETDAVYQWRWTSATSGGRAVAGVARGLERVDTLPAAPAGGAAYGHGEGRGVFTPPPAAPHTADEIPFQKGRAVPGAVFAWGGSLGGNG